MNMETIKKQIKLWCFENEKSITELAALADVTPSSIYRFLNGGDIFASTLEKIKVALGD